MGCGASAAPPRGDDVTTPSASPGASPGSHAVPPAHAPPRFDAAMAAGDAAAVAAALGPTSSPGRPNVLVQWADGLGRRALHTAAAAGQADVCQTLIRMGGADPNDADLLGDTPLLLAVAGGE
jgi:hypothetical protein